RRMPPRTLASAVPGGNSARARRANRGAARPDHHRDRRAGRGVEQRDQSLMRRHSELMVVRKDRNKLHAEAKARPISRHRGEPPFALGVDGGSRGDLDATGAEGPKSIFKRVEETVEVKESCHV